MAADIIDIDMGWNGIVSELKKMDGGYTKIGLPTSFKVASPKKQSKNRKPITSPFTLLKIALINEFGSRDGRIPSRAAIRQAFDMNINKISNMSEKFGALVILGKSDALTALGRMGEAQTSNIKRRITTLKSPKNSRITVKRKGSTNPLIDLGQYRASITHQEFIT